MPIELRGRHIRARIKPPSAFIKSSFRTHDVGRHGGRKRVAGRLKKTGKWATQSWLFQVAGEGKNYSKAEAFKLAREARRKGK